MRGALILVALAALVACQPPAPAPDPFAPIVATPLDAVPVASDPLPEPTPTPTPAPLPTPTPTPPEPPLLARQRAECQRAGGLLTPRGPGLYACVQPTRDAGQACDADADCEGLCLARSGTCAPLAPLYGCHEVFTAPGRRETLCTD